MERFDRVVFVPVIHTDTESVKKAREAVRDIRPDVVAVELDRTRYHQLMFPPEELPPTPGRSTGDGVQDLMNQIALLEQDLGQMTGASAGSEMLAAIEEGRSVGAKIALIDRPIEVTANALSQVPLDELYRLTNIIPDAAKDLADGGSTSLMDMLKEDGAIGNLMGEFRKEYPVLSRVLIEDRDKFIANAIRSILNDVKGKIVVVLGAGHIEGVSETLKMLLKER
jgi:pheromone shutdown protein TraB